MEPALRIGSHVLPTRNPRGPRHVMWGGARTCHSRPAAPHLDACEPHSALATPATAAVESAASGHPLPPPSPSGDRRGEGDNHNVERCRGWCRRWCWCEDERRAPPSPHIHREKLRATHSQPWSGNSRAIAQSDSADLGGRLPRNPFAHASVLVIRATGMAPGHAPRPGG